MTGQKRSGAAGPSGRIASLDLIRGIAVLGILLMNALTFALEPAGYSNLEQDGVTNPIDWLVGVLGIVFVQQKMMALFSLLFGVGVVIFADNASAKQRRPVALSLWRFTLLGLMGIGHTLVWWGDVLLVYALCAPIVVGVRRMGSSTLLAVGGILAISGSVAAVVVQGGVNSGDLSLGDYWLIDAGPMSAGAEWWYVLDVFGRALGLMLIGVALYRLGVVDGSRDTQWYRRLTRWGLSVGLALTLSGVAIHVANRWSEDTALLGHAPIGLGTIPMAVGYLGIILRWAQGWTSHHDRLAATGRMALTNYLSQTILGLTTLAVIAEAVDVPRSMILVWVIGVWALQVTWSTWWLARFRFGPAEWLWRCGTYRAWQPLRRRDME